MPINWSLVREENAQAIRDEIADLRAQLAAVTAERDALETKLYEMTGCSEWQRMGYTVNDYQTFVNAYEAKHS